VDFMSDALLSGRRFRTLNVINDFNRGVLAIEVDSALPGLRVTRVLDQIALERGYPQRIRVDNGPEFTSTTFHNWADAHSIHSEPGFNLSLYSYDDAPELQLPLTL
jgi:putative transposase